MSSDPPGLAVESGLDPQCLPAHVAIIMDGNGRWARRRLLNRVMGHEKGVSIVREVVRTCHELGIGVLTLYAFSTENWQRPRTEVAALMALLKRFLRSEQQELAERQIRLQAIGQVQRLPDDVRRALATAMELTGRGRQMQLNLALSYGGRAELLRAFQRMARQVQSGRLSPEAVTEAEVAANLYTTGQPDPDLLIRTSGEMRLSNFMLWQVAYAEIFVTDTLWPDFGRDELLSILRAYQQRDRRFGKVDSSAAGAV